MTQKKLDRRIVRTRSMLQKALIELIDERPYDSISVGDIADRATLRRATFYLHYPDKDALLLTLLDSNFEIAVRNAESPAAMLWEGSPSDAAFLAQLFGRIAERRSRWKNVLTGTGGASVARQIQGRLVERLVTESGGAEADAHFRAGGIVALLVWWLGTDSPHTPDEWAAITRKLTNGNAGE